MKTRDEYIETLKHRLDGWNDDIALWEARARLAREDTRARWEKALADARQRREEAAYQMKLLQGASQAAWEDVRKAADEAWDRMQGAMAQARTHFEKG